MEIKTIFILFAGILLIASVGADMVYLDDSKPNLKAQESEITITINESSFNVNNSNYLDGYDSSEFCKLNENNVFTGQNKFLVNDINSHYSLLKALKLYEKTEYTGYEEDLQGIILDKDGIYFASYSMDEDGGIPFDDLTYYSGIYKEYNISSNYINISFNNPSAVLPIYTNWNFRNPVWFYQNVKIVNGANISTNYLNSNFINATNINATNITSNYFKGNGSLLTDVCLSNGTNCASSGSGDNSSWNESYADTQYAQLNTRPTFTDLNLYEGGGTIYANGTNPGFFFDETNGAVLKGLYFVLDNGALQIQRRATDFGAFEASPFVLELRSPHYTFGTSWQGLINLGGQSSNMFEGVVNLNGSRTYAPQLVFRNSTLSTTTYAGSLERVDDNLLWRNNSKSLNKIVMLDNTKTGLTVNQYINATCTLTFTQGILTGRSAGC